MAKANPNPNSVLGRDDNDAPGETLQQLEMRQAAAAGSGAGLSVVKPAPLRTLQAGRVREAVASFNTWCVDVDHGVTPDDLKRTDFWVHNAKMFRIGDEVRVQCVDGSFVAYLLVRNVGPKDVKMLVREVHNFDAFEQNVSQVPAGYKVTWRGTIAKWGVIRGADVLKEQFDTSGDAVRWLDNHLKALER